MWLNKQDEHTKFDYYIIQSCCISYHNIFLRSIEAIKMNFIYSMNILTSNTLQLTDI